MPLNKGDMALKKRDMPLTKRDTTRARGDMPGNEGDMAAEAGRKRWLRAPLPGNDQLGFALTTGTTVTVAGPETTFLPPGRLTFRKPKVRAP